MLWKILGATLLLADLINETDFISDVARSRRCGLRINALTPWANYLPPRLPAVISGLVELETPAILRGPVFAAYACRDNIVVRSCAWCVGTPLSLLEEKCRRR
jgi:hypothetical protein